MNISACLDSAFHLFPTVDFMLRILCLKCVYGCTQPYLREIKNNFEHNDLYSFSRAVSDNDATQKQRHCSCQGEEENGRGGIECFLQPAAQGRVTRMEKHGQPECPIKSLQSIEDKNSWDPIMVFNMEPPKYQLKTQLYSNISVLFNLSIARKNGGKNKAMLSFYTNGY